MSERPSTRFASLLRQLHRYLTVMVLGFVSGLPLALTGQAMQAWLAIDGIDIATIGFFSLIGLPYTFKFVWAPLMDRFEPPWLGRRRGWLVLSQLSLAGALMLMASTQPQTHTQVFALCALLVTFLSASQDIVIDAYRTDILLPQERGLGSSLSVLGYRLAMILSGGIALIWADTDLGFGWPWSKIYAIMAAIMAVAAVLSLFATPAVPKPPAADKTAARNDLIGFASMLLVIVLGYQVTNRLIAPTIDSLFPRAHAHWANLVSLFVGVALTLPLAGWAAKATRFETLNRSLRSYFSQVGAVSFLILIILYKLGDAFAGALVTPFLIQAMKFAPAEVGVVNKIIGIWLTIAGALLGGILMVWLGLFRSLLVFGTLQLLSNFGFYLVAVLGKGAWGSLLLPPFDWIFVSLRQATEIDYLLLSAVAVENITGGMGTAAFVALLMALCNRQFTATQYALLSALAAIGRVWIGPLTGVLSEWMGWPHFFLLSIVVALPGLFMLWWLRNALRALETPAVATTTKLNAP